MTERFRCPLHRSTITSYGLEQVMLLCFVLRCIERGLIHQDAKSPWEGDTFYLPLGSEQFTRFQQLLSLLRNPKSSEQAIFSAIKMTCQNLYMPGNCFDLLSHPFLSVVIVYACLRSVHPQGGFWDPKRLTSIYAKMQFGIRLFLLHEAQDVYMRFDAEYSDGDKKYQEYMK